MSAWTEQEKAYLKDNYSKLCSAEIAESLGRTVRAVVNARYRMGFDATLKAFTEDEMSIIKKHYERAGGGKRNLDLNSLSRLLGRTKNIICRKAREMGLTVVGRKMTADQIVCASETQKAYHKNNPERQVMASVAAIEQFKKYGHPRGMLGKKHNEEFRKNISERAKRQWADPNHSWGSNEWRESTAKRASEMMQARMQQNPGAIYTRGKGGKRHDLGGQYFRSSWEANYARYLNFMGVRWEYEPKIFYFENIKRGTLSYTPDFYLPTEDRWVEVKGWLTKKATTAMKRFIKRFPEDADKMLFVVDKLYNKDHLTLLDMGYQQFESYREIRAKVGGLIDGWE